MINQFYPFIIGKRMIFDIRKNNTFIHTYTVYAQEKMAKLPDND